MPAEPKEPRTEAGLIALAANRQIPDNARPAITLGELRATLDAARDQAATEARRELLAKVERLPSWDGDESFVMLKDVIALIEERSDA